MYSQQLKSGVPKKSSTIIINSQTLTVNNIGLQHFQKHANIIEKSEKTNKLVVNCQKNFATCCV